MRAALVALASGVYYYDALADAAWADTVGRARSANRSRRAQAVNLTKACSLNYLKYRLYILVIEYSVKYHLT